ncbi:MAG TPA: ferritin-like domain-containing protein [Thermoleophilaceae bacterium]|nr:ferritin-like domain-containing protein [Thermoleophilaceae bacterium]
MAAYGGTRGDDYDESSAEAGTRKERKPAAGGDPAIVQYALTLEHLETDFYNAVINSDVKPPSRALARTIVMIRDNEREHVGALMSTIKEPRRHPRQGRPAVRQVVSRKASSSSVAARRPGSGPA